MLEGKLFASATPGCYTIGSKANHDISAGQAIEILLGGHWIAGHIAYRIRGIDASDEENAQNQGAYHVLNTAGNDEVIEASEESFPASDPPEWIGQPQKKDEGPGIVRGYYFIADEDKTICGLCIGMEVRTNRGQI